MTIKEAEARTGLARANIRYYEDQGFFSADRGENGYRNYSEENIDTLLKVKLLRQLGFALEDIHALQRGEQNLDTALEQREAGLEQERQELDQARTLCRIMREDGADFYTLDARRYLDTLAREGEVLSKDRDPVRIFPWRRFFARDLDILLCSTLLTVLLQLFARANVTRLNQDTGTSMLLKAAALVILTGAETLMLHFLGTTPGKALLGLKVLREDGSKLSLAEAGQRTVYVMVFYGFAELLLSSGVPLFVIGGAAMLIWACWQVYHEKPLFWEENQLYLDGSTKERLFWENGRNYLRVAGYLAAGAACVGLMVGGHLLVARPPHRGQNLTAEEFVENYNRYMAFTYGEENLSRNLTLKGTFEEKPTAGVVISLWGESPVPEAYFYFGQGGGGLTKVVLTQKYESGGPIKKEETYMAYVPYDEIYVAMRSLLWGRLGEKKMNSVYNDLVEAKGNYLGVLDGVQINSEMRFSGYEVWGDNALFAREGLKQSYFVEFSMTLTE